MKKLVLAAGFLFLTMQCFAINKGALEKHLRAMLSVDPRMKIEVGEAKMSDVAGLLAVPVTVGNGSYLVYMTPDEKKYIWGNLNDMSIDPDRSKMEKIKLTGVWSKGSKSAPVTIVEYTDLQCPYCSRAHEGLSDDLYKKYTKDQVRVVFKHYPLPMHNWAENAAVAAECAGQQTPDAFWKMTDFFFKNQPTLTKETVTQKSLEQAGNINLSVSKFQKCLSEVEPFNRVRADKQEGTDLGVASTPTLFINGRQHRGFSKFEDLQPLIDEKLDEAKARP